MIKARAPIAIDLDDNDEVHDFKPKTVIDRNAPSPEQVRAVSEKANFHSREPFIENTQVSSSTKKRHRKSNIEKVQFNIKADKKTIEEFYDIAKRNDWSLGETLSKTLEIFSKSYK